MMRVTQVINGLQPAGAERMMVELARGLQTRGHASSVVSLLPLPSGSPIVDELREARIPVRALGLGKRSPWRLLALGRLLRETQPDLVHAHMFHANLATRLAGGGRSYPLVNTVHLAEHRRGKRWLLLLDRLTLSRCDRETVVSEAARRFHARVLGVSPELFPVIHNGIPVPRSPSASERTGLREAWGVGGCKVVLGAAGRLDRQKGFDRLLEVLPALAPLVPEGETWGLVILGEGPEGDRLRRSAANAPPPFTVRLPGFRADAAVCAGAFDLFVIPSRFEGFGLTAVEAMAHGIPVVASDVDSLPEVLASYPLARVVSFEPGGASRVAEAMVALLRAGPERRPSFPFPVERMVEAYLRLYEELWAERGRVPEAHPSSHA